MNIHCRYRLEVDNRHRIRNPHGDGEKDMAIYANTLLKTRIPNLFRGLPRLEGHVTQIQQELNRLANEAALKGVSEEHFLEAIHTSKLIRSAIKAAKKAAVANHFPCPWLLKD